MSKRNGLIIFPKFVFYSSKQHPKTPYHLTIKRYDFFLITKKRTDRKLSLRKYVYVKFLIGFDVRNMLPRFWNHFWKRFDIT